MAHKIHKQFDTIDSYVKFASGKSAWKDCESQAKGSNFSGTSTFAEAVRLATIGWPEGRNKLAGLRDKLAARATFAASPTLVMDVAGAYPVAALAAAGDPASMVDLQPIEDRLRPIVRLMISTSYSAAYQAEEITNFGAALCCLIDGIEASGFRLELSVVAFCSKAGQDSALMDVTIKHAEDIAEIDRLSFVLTHPAWLRRISFGAIEQYPELESSMRIGYGSPCNPTEQELDGRIYLAGPNMFSPGSAPLKSPEAALQALETKAREAMVSHNVILPPLWGIDFMK